MTAHRIRGSLLFAAATLCAVLALIIGPVRPARADDLISYEIATAARAVQVFQDDGTGARSAEVEVPETTADLRSGPTGRAFSSIAWPGPTVGNLGSLLRVLAPQLPEQVTALNYPIRAEATTGQDPPTTSFNLPDISMTATASDELVESRATVGALTGEATPTNGFTTFGSARLRDGTPYGTATASVAGISLAGGLVKIGAVTSTATASSDGLKGKGSASTEIAGLSIAGIVVGLDQDGLRLADQSIPLGPTISATVNQALAAAGIELHIAEPVTTIVGAAATVSAPALVITIKSSAGVTGIVLGGATATVSGVGQDAPAVMTPAPPASDDVSFPADLPPSGSFDLGPVTAPSSGVSAPADAEDLPTIQTIVDDSHRIRGAQVALALGAALFGSFALRQLFLGTIGRGGAVCRSGAP